MMSLLSYLIAIGTSIGVLLDKIPYEMGAYYMAVAIFILVDEGISNKKY